MSFRLMLAILAMSATLWSTSLFAADEEPMWFKPAANGGNCNGCVWLAAEGRITENTAEDFRRAAQGRRDVLVRLNSNGGSALGGISLGYALRDLNASVVIGSTKFQKVDGYTEDGEEPGFCVSACALAFMGGIHRNAKDNELGVHRVFMNDPGNKITPDNDGMLRDGQIISALIIGYMQEMGIKTDIFSAIALTDRDEIRYLTTEEMVEWRVLNNSWRTNVWNIDISRRGPAAFTISEFGPSHTARLEYLCINGKANLAIKLRLPDSYIQDKWSGIGDPYGILASEIEIKFSKTDSQLHVIRSELLNRYRDETYLYGFINNSEVVKAVMIYEEIEISLTADMVSGRQYSDYTMSIPKFSLENSSRAISLIAKWCQ